MSSTNRGAVREASDYYVTPELAIMEFLKVFTLDNPAQLNFSKPLRILDPCAGGDAVRGMAYPETIRKFKGWNVDNIETWDIREDSLAERKGDYLASVNVMPFDIIITNPPFSLAVEVTQKALKEVCHGGLVIMLQRLNWFGSQERGQFWEHMPVACYVHRKRMGFMPKGSINPANGKPYGQDSIEYAHFVFQRGNNPEFTRLKII